MPAPKVRDDPIDRSPKGARGDRVASFVHQNRHEQQQRVCRGDGIPRGLRQAHAGAEAEHDDARDDDPRLREIDRYPTYAAEEPAVLRR